MNIDKEYRAFLRGKALPNPSPESKAERLFKTFHGKNPSKTRKVEISTPKALVELGRAVAIEYECTKRNGVKPSRAGKKNVFRHEMPKGNILSSNENGTLLIIRGPKLSVKKSGINH